MSAAATDTLSAESATAPVPESISAERAGPLSDPPAALPFPAGPAALEFQSYMKTCSK